MFTNCSVVVCMTKTDQNSYNMYGAKRAQQQKCEVFHHKYPSVNMKNQKEI